MRIPAHSVPTRASGLSPMQERVLGSKRFVRLVSAPTGTGKSYAFMRAVLDEEKQVLFIVPTKRLLQNLRDDACDQARKKWREAGWKESSIEDWIERRIIEWSGNQPAAAARSLMSTRAGQVLDPTVSPRGSNGRILFAIPEVVVRMLSGIRIAGAGAINPFSYLRQFDHVVFDEFHTIDDRAFGLACLFSLLAVQDRHGKVSLLSATPIDVTHTLEKMGIDRKEMDLISEEIVTGHPPDHRPIHGDVTLVLRRCTLAESVCASMDAVRAEIAANRTVIVVYDSLQRLKQAHSEIRQTLTDAGLDAARVLLINSIDDSERKAGEAQRGRRYADPRKYDVLICTSSIENGVTFYSSLMFTEIGFGAASLIQRAGRVSRGGDSGQVFISLPEDLRNRYPRTGKIAQVIEEHDQLDVQSFTAHLLRDERRRLQPTRKEAEADFEAENPDIPFFRSVSWRGAYWAALFAVAIQHKKMKIQKEARKRLSAISPGLVSFVAAKIKEISSVEIVNHYLPRQHQPHKQWVDALLTRALTYRDIGATIIVVDPDGTRHNATESFLRRATDIPLICFEEEGRRIIQLFSRTLDQAIEGFDGKADLQRMTLQVRSPIGGEGFTLLIHESEKRHEQINVRLVEEWQRRYSAQAENGESQAKVMAAATALVTRLGWAPLDEDYEDSAESAIFA